MHHVASLVEHREMGFLHKREPTLHTRLKNKVIIGELRKAKLLPSKQKLLNNYTPGLLLGLTRPVLLGPADGDDLLDQYSRLEGLEEVKRPRQQMTIALTEPDPLLLNTRLACGFFRSELCRIPPCPMCSLFAGITT